MSRFDPLELIILLLVMAALIAPCMDGFKALSRVLNRGRAALTRAMNAFRRRPRQAFRVIPLEDGPGSYLLAGVMRETEAECTWVIEARTRANAVAKAEIRGMVVTNVEKFRAANMTPLDV